MILAPTRELAMQINDVLSTYADEVGLRSTVLAGGMPYPPQLQALRKGVQIVVATPGRLQDHLKLIWITTFWLLIHMLKTK